MIAFMNGSLFEAPTPYHHCFELRERATALLFSADLQLHILELPKFTKEPGEIATPLDEWLYFLRHAESLDSAHLPGPLQRAAIAAAMKELTMIAQNQLERERYEARMKLQRDELSRLLSAREEGRDEGREEEARLRLSKSINFFERLLRRTTSSTAALGALSLEQLTTMADNLEAEVERAMPADGPKGNGAA